MYLPQQQPQQQSLKGVSFDHQRQLWKARIHQNNKEWFIGRFASQTEAAFAYDQVARGLDAALAASSSSGKARCRSLNYQHQMHHTPQVAARLQEILASMGLAAGSSSDAEPLSAAPQVHGGAAAAAATTTATGCAWLSASDALAAAPAPAGYNYHVSMQRVPASVQDLPQLAHNNNNDIISSSSSFLYTQGSITHPAGGAEAAAPRAAAPCPSPEASAASAGPVQRWQPAQQSSSADWDTIDSEDLWDLMDAVMRNEAAAVAGAAAASCQPVGQPVAPVAPQTNCSTDSSEGALLGMACHAALSAARATHTNGAAVNTADGASSWCAAGGAAPFPSQGPQISTPQPACQAVTQAAHLGPAVFSTHNAATVFQLRQDVPAVVGAGADAFAGLSAESVPPAGFGILCGVKTFLEAQAAVNGCLHSLLECLLQLELLQQVQPGSSIAVVQEQLLKVQGASDRTSSSSSSSSTHGSSSAGGFGAATNTAQVRAASLLLQHLHALLLMAYGARVPTPAAEFAWVRTVLGQLQHGLLALQMMISGAVQQAVGNSTSSRTAAGAGGAQNVQEAAGLRALLATWATCVWHNPTASSLDPIVSQLTLLF